MVLSCVTGASGRHSGAWLCYRGASGRYGGAWFCDRITFMRMLALHQTSPSLLLHTFLLLSFSFWAWEVIQASHQPQLLSIHEFLF